jgi:hypothetical protein
MADLKLHLDMDASRKDLFKALIDKGFDVTRTPNNEISEDASDEFQLLWATSNQRIIFTFNIKDFVYLSKKYPLHAGILLANQSTSTVSQLIQALIKVLGEPTSETWTGQVRWIRDWYE